MGQAPRQRDFSHLERVARKVGMKVHMDGARFANALVALGCEPADITWRAGVDVLTLGASKNGAFRSAKISQDFFHNCTTQD